ncbi:hypothetical protein [Streptomyces platensis]|uniref:hypothetical protein n=1 Tax=Streptomyces platensis TaxID=58346 RepID=UPI003F624E4D
MLWVGVRCDVAGAAGREVARGDQACSSAPSGGGTHQCEREIVRDDVDRSTAGASARIGFSAARLLAVPVRQWLTPHRRSSATE